LATKLPDQSSVREVNVGKDALSCIADVPCHFERADLIALKRSHSDSARQHTENSKSPLRFVLGGRADRLASVQVISDLIAVAIAFGPPLASAIVEANPAR